jgi:membrane fusion protein (multidrug efflux system)
MAEPALKFPPDQKPDHKEAPAEPAATQAADSPPRRGFSELMRRYRRPLLLVVLPPIALIGGLIFYLSGGRYVTTDDAYVGALKVLITPEISGKIDKVTVKEGQHVKTGDLLFEIDPVPFRLAVQQAQAKLNDAKIEYDTLKANLANYAKSSALAQQSIDVKQRDVDRKTALVKSNAGSRLDLDNAISALVQAQGVDRQCAQQAARRPGFAAREIS